MPFTTDRGGSFAVGATAPSRSGTMAGRQEPLHDDFWACHAGSPVQTAVVASFISVVFFWVRGGSIAVIRPLIWFSLFPYLLDPFVASIDRRAKPLVIGRLTLIGHCMRRESGRPV